MTTAPARSGPLVSGRAASRWRNATCRRRVHSTSGRHTRAVSRSSRGRAAPRRRGAVRALFCPAAGGEGGRGRRPAPPPPPPPRPRGGGGGGRGGAPPPPAGRGGGGGGGAGAARGGGGPAPPTRPG